MDTPFLTSLWATCFFCVLPISNKKIKFVGGHPINISTKFGSKWPCGFREED